MPVQHLTNAELTQLADELRAGIPVLDPDEQRIAVALYRLLAEGTPVAEGAGDVILAAVYAVQFGLTVDQIVDTWAPYLTMSEAFKLAAQTFDREVAYLSCCA